MRIILKCNLETPRELMLNALKWMSISQRIKYNAFVMIYKMMNGLLPKYLCDKLTFARQIHNIETRQRNHLRTTRCNTKFAERNIFIDGVRLFNKLPNNIKEMRSIDGFKLKCAEYVMSKI